MNKIILSIIIPVYNEERFINIVIEKVKGIRLPDYISKEIIIVDDRSTDETSEILKKYNVDPSIKIFSQENHMGKTSAVKLGIERSTGDIILIQDADLEYSPDDYPQLIEPFMRHQSSVVYGSRFKGSIKGMSLINRIGNILSNVTLNLLYNSKLSDVLTCFKVFKSEVLKSIRITSKNFAFETEITAKLLNKGYKIYEVPIRYVARSKKEGKKITWPKAIGMYWGMIKYRIIRD